MKPLLLLLFVSCSLFSSEHPLLKRLAYDSDWFYQDILINGQTIHHGTTQSCPDRYEAIRPILDQYERPITVLDLGANNGYFSLRVAKEYPSVCVMVDTTDRLKEICAANTALDNLIYLKKRFDVEALKDLNKREHFDVIIAFHVLHHAGRDGSWKEFCAELFKLGDNIIIETPPKNDTFAEGNPTIGLLADYLTSHPDGKQIASFPRIEPHMMDHMLWFCFKPKGEHERLYLEGEEPGISYLTFRRHRGRFPLKETVQEEKSKLPLWKRHIKKLITMEGKHLY